MNGFTVSSAYSEPGVSVEQINKLWEAGQLLLNGDATKAEQAVLAIEASGKRFNMSKLTDPMKETRAWGIASGIVADYFKVRTYVRLVYEEVKLWNSVVKKFKDIRDYIKEMGYAFDNLYQNFSSLFTTWDGLLPKLESIIGVNDQITALKLMPKTLDHKIADLEKTWDTMTTVNKKFTYSIGGGMLKHTTNVPDGGINISTESVLKFVDKQITDSTGRLAWSLRDYVDVRDGKFVRVNSDKGNKKMEISSNVDIKTVADTMDPQLVKDPFRHYTLPIESNRIVASQALASSIAYRKWAQMELINLAAVDDAIEDIAKEGGINGVEFAAAWYSIMNINANNKKLLHSVQEAKLLSAILGTELHNYTNRRADQLRILKQGKDIKAELGRL